MIFLIVSHCSRAQQAFTSETGGVDPTELLVLAQLLELCGNLELATGENPPDAETVTVADLVQNLKDLGKGPRGVNP
jgi:hypothetical protein